ncbi:MAG: DUF962 domain-containing protein [Siculibacillus sp.]|nr:DUF962 domain-containing protein [Siculibacillus sp.]
MSRIAERLGFYTAHHRDRRNVATHFVGIPMIMVAIAGLSAPVSFGPVSAAMILAAAALAFYLHVSPMAATVMLPVVAIVLAAGHALASLPSAGWPGWSLGLFVIGWIFQAIGHVFEGRKPAFFDDLRGLLDGPLFLMAEIGFALGLAPGLKREIDEIARSI